MNKLVVGIVGAGVIAGVAALGCSYYVGGQIEQSLEQATQEWSAQEGFAVSILEYERGIVGAKAKTQWSFDDEDEHFEIIATHDITHGPWARGQAGSIDSRFPLPEDSDPDLQKALQGRAALEMFTRIGWQGQTEHTFTSPEVTVNFADGSDMGWGGLQAALSVSAERTAAQGWARMPALKLKSEDGSRLELQDTTLDFSGTIVAGHSFWDGPASMKVGSVRVFEPEGASSITLQGVALDSTTSVREDMIDTSFKVHVANIDAPGYATSDMQLHLSLKNIASSWLDQLLAWTQGNMQDDAHRMELLRSLPVLLERKPEIAIERLAIRTPEGHSELSARLAYQGENTSTFDPLTDLYGSLRASMPQALLKMLMAEKVRSDYATLLEQLGQEMEEAALQAEVDDGVQKRIQGLLNNDIVRVQGDTFSAELEYSQGDIKLNGVSTSLQKLWGIGGAM